MLQFLLACYNSSSSCYKDVALAARQNKEQALQC